MRWTAMLSVFAGAGLGGLLRHGFNVRFNALAPNLPGGTLLANLLGGYLVGLAAGIFLARSQLAPELRLLVITGFLGGLTTFSAFSLEVATHVQQGRLGWAAGSALIHVCASVALTLLGLASARVFAP
jgi:CrcB protein